MTHVDEALDDRLVAAALARLRSEPAERLSLRRVAQAVGVSHQAPYVHFGSKQAFLAAVAGAGLHRAAARAQDALAAAGDDPLRRLHALVDAYIGFIHDDPHVHDLAYGPLVAKADHPRLQRAAIDYWNLLHDVVAVCQPTGTGEDEVLRRSAVAWGTVQGIARLHALGQIPLSVPGDGRDLVHEAVDTLYRGWQGPRPARPHR